MRAHKLIAIFLAIFAVAAQAATYIITGSGTSFTAKESSRTIISGEELWYVISAIRDDASGEPCTIQFGNGTAVLDIGDDNIYFYNDTYSRWGQVTLTGKIKSEINYSSIIAIQTDIFIATTADITNTGSEYAHAKHRLH